MIKVKRPQLPKELQQLLDDWQAAVNRCEVSHYSWNTFKRKEKDRTEAGESTVFSVLMKMFHGKCAYCETPDADEIDHYWPKSPHSALNGNRGTSARMFRWNNLLLSCHKCNSWECKGAHMKWDNDKPRLLNPCTDNPLCHFQINLDYGYVLDGGGIRQRSGLSSHARKRAEYTIRRLKLNERNRLRRSRLDSFRNFFDWLEMLLRFGPEYELPSGYTIRQRMKDMLRCSEPYLAPIRQFLHLRNQVILLRDENFIRKLSAAYQLFCKKESPLQDDMRISLKRGAAKGIITYMAEDFDGCGEDKAIARRACIKQPRVIALCLY